MKILMINVVCGIRSTGRICTDLAETLNERGDQVKIVYGREAVPEKYEKFALKMGSDAGVKMHALKARLFDRCGFGSTFATRDIIKQIEEYDPDIIHLHNIHGYYINVEELFKYLKRCGKKVVWTLHDCWSFTGHCAYFDYVECEKWKTGCHHCEQKTEYPARNGFDMSKKNFAQKKEIFTGVENMTLVTPSRWLSDLVSQSYLKEYEIKVIPNGVDTSVFKPTPSNIKERYSCTGKKVILGVAAVWDKRKGLDSFIELSQRLDDSYKIILVGLDEKQIQELPENIIGIQRTNSVSELAELYSAADVFVNPTLEDNYPTTNIEAIACGTPVITFETGGSTESAEMYGVSVPRKDTDALIEAIMNVENITKKDIDIDYKATVRKYMKLYEEHI